MGLVLYRPILLVSLPVEQREHGASCLYADSRMLRHCRDLPQKEEEEGQMIAPPSILRRFERRKT